MVLPAIRIQIKRLRVGPGDLELVVDLPLPARPDLDLSEFGRPTRCSLFPRERVVSLESEQQV